jgi:hypothetical protein
MNTTKVITTLQDRFSGLSTFYQKNDHMLQIYALPRLTKKGSRIKNTYYCQMNCYEHTLLKRVVALKKALCINSVVIIITQRVPTKSKKSNHATWNRSNDYLAIIVVVTVLVASL